MGKNSARRFLYLATMIVIVLILFLQNKYISVCLAIAFSLGAGVFLYKNITLLTDVSEDRVKTRTLRASVLHRITAPQFIRRNLHFSIIQSGG